MRLENKNTPEPDFIMNPRLKIIFGCLAIIALAFGFLHLAFPNYAYNFERLHVFLFNLCAGGSLILFFTLKRKELPKRVTLFLLLSITYAVLAFLRIYIPAMTLSIILAAISESIRIEKFSFFPWGFFSSEEPVHLKFQQASLLCLSMGLIISTLVILNNEYLGWISMPKLKLDTFFLGFSFPLSLITFSLIFSFMSRGGRGLTKGLKEIGFWTVNLGVIIFFTFILFEKFLPQVVVTSLLFSAVIMILFLFYKLCENIQQKQFLISGMGFLVVTAISGIVYIFLSFSPGYSAEKYKWLLQLHAFAALYGWNLCGLAVICRYNDFPVKLHSAPLIVLHWITVLVLAPLGKFNSILAVAALAGYSAILFFLLFSEKSQGEALGSEQKTRFDRLAKNPFDYGN